MTPQDIGRGQEQYYAIVNGLITVENVVINLRLLATAEFFPSDEDHDEARVYLYFSGSGLHDQIYRGAKAENIYAALRNLSVVMP